jgi:hypothetical protein
MATSHSSGQHHSKAVPIFHYVLKNRIEGGETSLPITREEAKSIIRKWTDALRHQQKGHRTLFILHAHKGRCFDRLVLETHHHRARKRSAEEAQKPWCRR